MDKMRRIRFWHAAASWPRPVWYGLVVASALFMLPLLFAPLGATVSGGAWQSFGLRGQSVLSLVVVPADNETIFYGQTHTGLWRRVLSAEPGAEADAGNGWQRIDNGLPHSAFGAPSLAAWRSVPGRPLHLYALAGPTDARHLYRSEDGGSSWHSVGPTPGQSQSPAFAVVPGPREGVDTIMIATPSRLQRSLDGGATWTPGGVWPQPAVGGDRGPVDVVRELIVDEADPDRLLILSRSGELWLSENGGLSWRITGLEDYDVTSATFAPGQALWAASTGPAATVLLYSLDNATSWAIRALPAQPAPFLSGSVRVVALEPEPGIADSLYSSVARGQGLS